MKLNLRDPRTRQRVLLGGAAFGLLAALIYSRSKGSSAAQVGTTVDPTALDPAGLTTGLPSALDGGGGIGADPSVIASDTSADVGSLTSALYDALATLTDLFTPSDPSANITITPPAPEPAWSPVPAGFTGIIPGFSTDAQGKLIPHGSIVTVTPAPSTLQAASPSARTIQKQSSSSAPVNSPPTSGVARSAPVLPTVVAVDARPIVPVGRVYAA